MGERGALSFDFGLYVWVFELLVMYFLTRLIDEFTLYLYLNLNFIKITKENRLSMENQWEKQFYHYFIHLSIIS